MNQQDRHDLQLWLDGGIDEQGRAAFEQRIAADPELRAELELHQRVGESLRRNFTLPKITAPLPAGSARPPRWPLFLLGAVSAAAVLLVWLQPWIGPVPGAVDRHGVEVMRTAVGRSWLAVCNQLDELSPQVACLSPGELPQYVQPLAPKLPSPLRWRERPGVRFQRGLESKPQDGLRVLELVVLPQTEVFLFVVPASADPRPALPQDSDWNLFRRRCGPLVVYELTPLDMPHGLQCLAERQ